MLDFLATFQLPLLLAAAEPLELPTGRLEEISLWRVYLNHPTLKALWPIPVLAVVGFVFFKVFGKWWRELDQEARELRESENHAPDYRPAVCLVIVAVSLTLQEYYGGRRYYDAVLRPWLEDLETTWTWIELQKWDEYYGYCWWSFTRVLGYVLIPFPLWKLLFRKDSLLDMGLRTKGLWKHAWVYLALFLALLPVQLVVATGSDFINYYPFYKQSSRSWFDFLMWQVIYYAQFLTLELFFRGFMVNALKRMGAGAIFVMAVPYCMIHYGKPYTEALGAIVAGVLLGTLAMRTKSAIGGFLLHISVALTQDLLSLFMRNALPSRFWPL